MTPDEMKALVADALEAALPTNPITMHNYESLSAHPDEETEWEYGVTCGTPECTEPHEIDSPDDAEGHEVLWRRTPYREIEPGPWEPVPTDGEGPDE